MTAIQNDQIDKLTEMCLSIEQYLKAHPEIGDNRPSYDDLIASFERQIGRPLAECRKLDALVFAYHLGYFAGKWGVTP